MSQKQQSVNCVSICGVRCKHHAAPRRLLSMPYCIILFPSDDRRVPKGCVLQVERPRPMAPIAPPRTLNWI